ncbi:PAS domain-containing protein [Methylobacterium aquaticum]|uniref:histidine kinase n=1 Tax=Methylobacterium aquaticum TaxID=270351 RepID=A0A0J6VQI6_9HYPH|nr:PAS domain-containing protein [Methylobacterium aquaticum]KMO41486.1 histidine kinase [Methylobacterium aquaticum]
MNTHVPGPSLPTEIQADVLAVEGIAAVPLILDVVCRTTGMGFAAVARVTEDRWVACSVRDGIGFGLRPGGELPLATTICNEIRGSGTEVVIDHVAEDPAFRCHPTPALYGFQSYASMPIRLPDGSFFGTLCAIDPRPARVSDPGVVGMFRSFAELIGFHVDAHRRLAGGEALRRSESFVRSILAASPDCVKVLSADGVLAYMSAHGAVLNQIDCVQDILGREYASLWPADEQAKLRDAVRRAAAGETVRIEGLCPTAKGEPRWWEVSFAPFVSEEGGGTKLVAISRDITERYHAEADRRAGAEALRSLNEDLERQVADRTAELRLSRDIIASSAAPICAFDTDYRVIAFNQAHSDEFFRMFAHRVRIGEVFPDLLPPDQAPVMRALMTRALTGEVFTVTEEFGDPDLAKPCWEVSYSPLRDQDGRIVGAFHYAKDVSMRLQAEAELARTQEALRQSQKMEAVGQLTGGVAHDFNNLLTIIRSSVDFLRRPELPEDRKRRYLDAVSDTVDRAAKLTGQLLAFARRQALKPEVFEVGERLRAAAEMLDTVTGARIRLDVELPEDPCFAKADLSQFETALVNMAVNARDAMDGEGVLTLRLTRRAGLPPIRGHAGAEGAFVAVSLGDTGRGIAPDQLARIFEPFFTTKPVGKGTGLGLSQVFGFAKQSGGDVDVETRLGRGTTFTLYLPEVDVVPDRLPGRAVEPDAGSPMGTGQSILVVEDNVEVGRFATQTLDDLGYRTALAVNAEDALDKLGADGGGYDAVFSDVVMPGMGGVALAKELRNRFPGLPVLLASGYSHVLAQDGVEGFELLHKPYSAEQLARILRHLTTRRPVGPVG